MFNEQALVGENYSVSITGDLLFPNQNIITEYDREFIHRLLALNEVKAIYVARKKDDGVNHYYIECVQDCVLCIVDNMVDTIYLDITNYAPTDWDIIDTVYMEGDTERQPQEDDICMYIINTVNSKRQHSRRLVS